MGCGLQTKKQKGETHAYMESSPACWNLYGQILAREYSDPQYMSIHALTVDAYALQHPGKDNPQAVSSVYVHLHSLHGFFAQDVALAHLPVIRRKVAGFSKSAQRLEPPYKDYIYHVTDVLTARDADEHIHLVTRWAESVYMHWSHYHEALIGLYQKWVLE